MYSWNCIYSLIKIANFQLTSIAFKPRRYSKRLVSPYGKYHPASIIIKAIDHQNYILPHKQQKIRITENI